VRALVGANLAVRFALELCALAALAYWGWQATGSTVGRVLLAIGAPLAAALLWGALVAPKAWVRARRPVRLLAEAAVFGAAVAGLAAAGEPALAAALGVAALVSGAVNHAVPG
jgi:Protein of unknown function (DUF2568)